MRNVCTTVLSAADNVSTNGTAIDSNQLVSASFQAYFGDALAGGTLKLQASNDLPATTAVSPFTPTNWVDIPSQTATITTGTSALLTVGQMAYKWIRAVYTNTAAGVQTITPIADTGRKQAQTVTAVADVAGSLNSTYFLLSSVNTSTKAQKNFYLWLDNGSGVDPAVPARTAIHVTYSNDDTANTLATAIRAALNALSGDFVATGSNAAVIITNVAFGPVTAAADGSAPTGFSFGSATAGIASNLNNTYFLLQDQGSAHTYYVWFNVDTIGTDPAVGGRTGVPIAISSGATAATIGTGLASAIAALNSTNSFTTAGTTTVTVTNKVVGAFTPMSDGTPPTGFTFAVTAGGNSTVTVLMNALSL